MNDGLSFSVSTVDIPSHSKASVAFKYMLPADNLRYHIDFERSGPPTENSVDEGPGVSVKNLATPVDSGLEKLRFVGGSVLSKVGNQKSLFAQMGKKGDPGVTLFEETWNKGATSYNRRNKQATKNSFKATYPHWEMFDDNHRAGFNGYMYSTPSSWSVACASPNNCDVRQRSNIHAWMHSRNDNKRFNWRAVDNRGTMLWYPQGAAEQW
jgi:hypothetical protein